MKDETPNYRIVYSEIDSFYKIEKRHSSFLGIFNTWRMEAVAFSMEEAEQALKQLVVERQKRELRRKESRIRYFNENGKELIMLD